MTITDITMPMSPLAITLDKERNEHQATRGLLEGAIEDRENAEAEAALYRAVATQVLIVLQMGPLTLEAIVASVNRQLAREIIEERRDRHARPALDSAARAIAGKSAAELNAALGLEVREHPLDFDPSGGHP